MSVLKEPQLKHLTADGAVTTNNKGGVLHYVIFTGQTVGDKLVINDGTTAKITLVTSVAWAPVILDWMGKDKAGSRPVFTTDIDADFTLSTSVAASFIYEEIQG